MNMNELKIIKRQIKNYFKEENTGHDFKHLNRVYKNAKHIQKFEGGNQKIILISAYVHDFHRLMSKERYVTPKESLPVVKDFLKKCKIDKKTIKKVLNIVEFHEEKQNAMNFCLEAKVLMDADALDAVGKIGLKRTLKYCKAKNIPLIDKNFDLNCNEYLPDIKPISTCHYIYRTMIPNAKNINTKTGKQIAKRKIEVLNKFLKNQLGYEYMKNYLD